jgi:RNA polymerase sigma-70 factor (ECF subfamily)
MVKEGEKPLSGFSPVSEEVVRRGRGMNRQDDFLKLFLQHQADIKAFIGSLILDAHLRDDVFQEVALALWRQMDSYDWERSFGGWARGIAAHKILQLRDQNARFPAAFAPQTIQAILDEFDRTEEIASRKMDALRECLKQLPARSRDLLNLRYERNLGCEQIARQTQRTLDAVYQTLSRIRTRLEECIRRRLAFADEGVARNG